MNFEDYKSIFIQHGGQTHVHYLEYHFSRIIDTRQRLSLDSTTGERSTRLLDIGAHFLHQTLLYALEGFEVTAANLPLPFRNEATKSIANTYTIQLHEYSDLSAPDALSSLPESYFDVILFTEILEHLVFNPVEMWKQIYRVMAPNAKIIVTTPNYYYWRKFFRSIYRLARGQGAGIDVSVYLHSLDTAPHWKEYSASEIKTYFSLLSPDFVVGKIEKVNFEGQGDDRPLRKLLHALFNLCPSLRKNLYVEVELSKKEKGILIEPYWT